MKTLQLIILLIASFFSAEDLYAQLVAFKNESGKTGFKNAAGIVVVKPQFSNYQIVGPSPDGKVKGYCVSIDSLYGFYDSEGKEICPVKYTYLTASRDNRYLFVTFENRAGILDFKGNIIFPFDYEELGEMGECYRDENPYFYFRKEGKYGVMNERFEITVPARYDYVESVYLRNMQYDTECQSGPKTIFFRLQTNGEEIPCYGLADSTGKIIVPVDFHYVEPLNVGYYYCGNSQYYVNVTDFHGFHSLYNQNGKLIIPMARQEIELIYVQQDSCGFARNQYALIKDERKQTQIVDLVSQNKSNVYDEVRTIDAGFVCRSKDKWEILGIDLKVQQKGIVGTPFIFINYHWSHAYRVSASHRSSGEKALRYNSIVAFSDDEQRSHSGTLFNATLVNRSNGRKLFVSHLVNVFFSGTEYYYWCAEEVISKNRDLEDHFKVRIYNGQLEKIAELPLVDLEATKYASPKVFYKYKAENRLEVKTPEGEMLIVDYSGKAVSVKNF